MLAALWKWCNLGRGDVGSETTYDSNKKVPVLIAGPCGTGKSHLAQAIGHCAVRIEKDVLFTTQSKMLGQLHAATASHPYDRKFKALVTSDLLIIDDFGLKPLIPPLNLIFTHIFSEHREGLSFYSLPPLWGKGLLCQLLNLNLIPLVFSKKCVPSPALDEDLHAVVAELYEKGTLIVTSDLDFDEWKDAFPNKILGAVTLDR